MRVRFTCDILMLLNVSSTVRNGSGIDACIRIAYGLRAFSDTS